MNFASKWMTTSLDFVLKSEQFCAKLLLQVFLPANFKRTFFLEIRNPLSNIVTHCNAEDYLTFHIEPSISKTISCYSSNIGVSLSAFSSKMRGVFSSICEILRLF